MDLTPKQQTSEAIRQAETILILTGQHPSVDQVCAVIGFTQILRKFGKKVTAVVTDSMPAAVQQLETSVLDRGLSGMRDFVLKLDVSKAEVDKLRYEVQDGKLNIFITPFKGGFAPSDVTFDYGSFQYDLVIVVGVPTRARLDRIFEQNQATFEQIPMVNLDFHRSNEGYGAVNLIEPNASSLCEMLVATSESLQGGLIDDQIATTLLMGIVASTDRFTATHTTSKSLTVAAQMMAAGGRQQSVVKALYRGGDRGEQRGGQDPQRGGQERGGQERSGEQRAERSDRPQRDQRPAASTGGGRDGRTEGNRSERPEAARSERADTPRREQPDAPRSDKPDPRAGEREQRNTERREQSAPTPSVTPERPHSEMPIIDPGHIELSEPDEAEAQLEQEPEANIPPMADFAAAAEILARRDDDNGPENKQ